MSTPLVALLALGAVICVALAVPAWRQAILSRWIAHAARMARGPFRHRVPPVVAAVPEEGIASLNDGGIAPEPPVCAGVQRAEETLVETQPSPSEIFDCPSLDAVDAPGVDRTAGRTSGAMMSEQLSLRGKRVLVMDDNATDRTILELQTRSWGMEPVLASSGSEALELIRGGEPFDLAILDMQLPEMEEMALAQEIRRHHGADALPMVVLTSAEHQEADVRLDLFAAFLARPVKATQLYNTLVEVIVVGEGLRMRRE